MRLSLRDDIEGLTQRLQLLNSLEDPNASVLVTNEHPVIAPAASPRRPAVPSVRLELVSQSQKKFVQLDQAFEKLSIGRKQRLEDLKAREQARIEALRQKAEEEARKRREEEEARIAKAKAEQEAKEKAEQEARKAEEERKAKAEAEAKKAAEAAAAAQKAKDEEAKKAAEAQKVKEEQEKKAAEAKKAEEAKAAAEAAQAAQAASVAPSATGGSSSDSSSAATEHAQHMETIQLAKTEINPQVSANRELKKECYELKIAIKAKLGQLTHSKKHLIESVTNLKEVFARAQGLGELGYYWVLNQFSKLVVQQAEGESRVDGRSAVPISMLVTLIWADHPALGRFLIARFVKKDPYVIGYNCSIDTEQGRKRMGYRRSASGWESDVEYGERIGGITSVWAVITQSKMSVKASAPHPYPITHSWIFISRTLNLPVDSLTEAHFCAVAAWWDVAGSRFLEAFGKQGDKLLSCAATSWCSSVADRKYAAANRLRLLGEDWKKQGKIEPIWKPLGP